MEGPEEKLEHRRSFYQFSLRMQAHPAAEVESRGRSVLGSLREALSLCNHALTLYSQEPNSELGATLGQTGSAIGMWSGGDQRQAGTYCACLHLSITDSACSDHCLSSAFQNQVQVLLLINPKLAHNKGILTVFPSLPNLLQYKPLYLL